MKKKAKIILGIIIGLLVMYSVLMTLSVYVVTQDYNNMNASNRVAAKATENKTEYYQMMGFAYSMASAIESGKYDEEQVDELYAIRAEQRNYDESLFRKCVELILDEK